MVIKFHLVQKVHNNIISIQAEARESRPNNNYRAPLKEHLPTLHRLSVLDFPAVEEIIKNTVCFSLLSSLTSREAFSVNSLKCLVSHKIHRCQKF